MNKKIIILLIVFFGCKQSTTQKLIKEEIKINEEDFGQIEQRTFNANEKPKLLKLFSKESDIDQEDFMKNLEMVFLEENAKSSIGEISKVAIFGDRIVILDALVSKCVFVFTSKGEFLFRIDESRQCPSPDDFSIVNNNLYILSKSKNILKYSLKDGRYLERRIIPFFVASFAAENTTDGIFNLKTLYNNPNNAFEHYWVIKIDYDKGRILSKDFPKNNAGKAPLALFNIYGHNTDVFFVKFLSDTVFKINKDMVTPIFITDFSGRGPNDEWKKRIIENSGNIPASFRKTKLTHGISNFIASDSWYYASFASGQRRYHNYINRSTGRIIDFKTIKDRKYLGAISGKPLGSYKDKFIYHLNTRMLKSRIKELTKLKVTKEINEIVNRLKGNNPVLVLASP